MQKNIMHLLYFLGYRVIFSHAEERMICIAPSVLHGRPRHLLARKRKDVISCTFCTSWEAVSSSRMQKKGCDIMHLLYFLGCRVISLHTKEYHEPSVLPGRSRNIHARKRISWTFCTSWEATSPSCTQKNIMNLLNFMGGHVISLHAKEYHEPSELHGRPRHIIARKRIS
jgi:hypothetical protein